jgi:hypothetical protein
MACTASPRAGKLEFAGAANDNFPLVPAKAGTQFTGPYWIPAYAGMNGEAEGS